MSVDETNNIGTSTVSPQSKGPVVLHYEQQNMTRRSTRAEIMALGASTVIGNDSTTHQEPHPGQWTLVKDINMESREPQKVWRQTTRNATQHLAEILKNSLLEHPHPELSQQAIACLEEMRRNFT
ncbi:uncharacterized protein LOC130641203 [Hydractinia symbiolongicarpus]|uniref:uncharacterized protein LOC130640833 n=1 Tax=Hydractinia symbiolongicarpus TaxID=13093 RepID=UPI00254DA9B4|nr:uncharacterized protein LOC130640833 [Hydractinia symbiolongicarpus]XP_057303887.1 uncharacterized protein LOC130641203 [Hydractinia symbiolongicarpus]